MKITIDLDPTNPSTPDILRKLADMVEAQRVPVDVPAPAPSVPWQDRMSGWADRVRVQPGRVIPMTPEPMPTGPPPWVGISWMVAPRIGGVLT